MWEARLKIPSLVDEKIKLRTERSLPLPCLPRGMNLASLCQEAKLVRKATKHRNPPAACVWLNSEFLGWQRARRAETVFRTRLFAGRAVFPSRDTARCFYPDGATASDEPDRSRCCCRQGLGETSEKTNAKQEWRNKTRLKLMVQT